jgi:hypothetical protein
MPRKLTQEEIDARRQAVEGTWITIQTLKEESETLKNKRKVIAAQIKEQERNQNVLMTEITTQESTEEPTLPF